MQVSPNPFRDQVKINVKLPVVDKGKKELSIYNSTGMRIKSFNLIPDNLLFNNSLTWDGRDDLGNHLSNGVYLLKFVSDGDVASLKLILVR
jgi:flagellar hook assembly protein FlgD